MDERDEQYLHSFLEVVRKTCANLAWINHIGVNLFYSLNVDFLDLIFNCTMIILPMETFYDYPLVSKSNMFPSMQTTFSGSS